MFFNRHGTFRIRTEGATASRTIGMKASRRLRHFTCYAGSIELPTWYLGFSETVLRRETLKKSHVAAIHAFRSANHCSHEPDSVTCFRKLI